MSSDICVHGVEGIELVQRSYPAKEGVKAFSVYHVIVKTDTGLVTIQLFSENPIEISK